MVFGNPLISFAQFERLKLKWTELIHGDVQGEVFDRSKIFTLKTRLFELQYHRY